MKTSWKTMLAGALAAMLLTGCGSNAAESGGAAGSASSGAAGSETGAAKAVTLKMFVAIPRFKQQFDQYVEQFKAKMKAEKNIDLTVQMEMPTADTAPQILKTRLASNDAPDIFSLHAINEIPSFYKAGYLADLSGQPFTDKLLDSVKSSVSIDGKIVAVPLETLSWGYLYNKAIFAEHGLTPPATLSEMKTLTETLQAKGVTPFLLSYSESWIPQLVLPLAAGALINTENPDFIDRMNRDEGSFQELKAMFDIFVLINANGTDRALEVGGDDGAAAFAQGKAAMWLQGPWYADTILKSDPDFNFGVAALPVNDNPDATMINLSTSTSLAVSPDSKNKEIAIEFINYVLDDNDSNAFYESLKFNPLATVHTFDSFSWVNDATEYVKQGKSYQDPVIPQAVKDEVGKGLQSYYAGQMTQDDVLNALDRAWKNYNKVNQ